MGLKLKASCAKRYGFVFKQVLTTATPLPTTTTWSQSRRRRKQEKQLSQALVKGKREVLNNV